MSVFRNISKNIVSKLSLSSSVSSGLFLSSCFSFFSPSGGHAYPSFSNPHRNFTPRPVCFRSGNFRKSHSSKATPSSFHWNSREFCTFYWSNFHPVFHLVMEESFFARRSDISPERSGSVGQRQTGLRRLMVNRNWSCTSYSP